MRIGHYNQAILLTGRRGVGKTTVCQAVAELARRRGYRLSGVITPALYNSCGAKVGFEAVDVCSGKRWPLARTDQELGGPRMGPYSFDPTGLAKALRILRKAITIGCDLLIIDEIGPLELEQSQGFAPILDVVHWRSSRTCSAPAERETVRLSSPKPSFATPEENSEDSLTGGRPMHTLIVIRPDLLDQLLLRLKGAEFTIFNVTEENRDELPLQILERF